MRRPSPPTELCRFFWVVVVVAFGSAAPAFGQYPWPVPPFDASHVITGTFGEYRGPSNPHFHDGTDVPATDGSPVYAVADGVVTSLDPNGANAFVRAQEYAYVHVRPNPALSIGDSVFAQETIVGTIVPGQGHVHFKDGLPGEGRNALRAGGGLTPYADPWAPRIADVRFYLLATGQRIASTQLADRVEITFRVEEANGPPGSSRAVLNNGAYVVGYRVLTRDRQTVAYTPSADGVQFRFDAIPSNAFVHHVFAPLQASTSAHVYRATNRTTRIEGLDTALLDEGPYTIELFAEDTRGNRAEVYVDVEVTRLDLVPPPPATLLGVGLPAANGAPTAQWHAEATDDLAGFRLYLSADVQQWVRPFNERALPAARRTATLNHPPAGAAAYYYVTAADQTQPANESDRSDVYGMAELSGPSVLVVDGFDRIEASGSWRRPWHDFAARHGRALLAAGYGFTTTANEQVSSGQVDLGNYDAVVWLLGDESTRSETFSAAEQRLVESYLEGGGKLLVSGSEIGWDLGAQGSAQDRLFLRDYLKVTYAGDDAESYQVRGTDGGPFAGLTFRYGSYPYTEDWPDYFAPAAGASDVLRYANGRIGGVAYAGPFGSSTAAGQVLLLGFPFETIAETAQAEVMRRAMATFFGSPTASSDGPLPPTEVTLHPPYPNPARGHVTIPVELPTRRPVRIEAYDVLGRRVAVVFDGALPAGRHVLAWTAAGLADGMYWLRLRAGSGSPISQPVTLLR